MAQYEEALTMLSRALEGKSLLAGWHQVAGPLLAPFAEPRGTAGPIPRPHFPPGSDNNSVLPDSCY
jgi:hypothetical protein